MKRSPIRNRRTKPRPGRLDSYGLSELREACYNRDHAICQECGHQCHDGFADNHPRKYHMAHIKAKRMGGDSLDNVRTLCGDCHRKEHNYGPSMTKPVPSKAGEQPEGGK